MNPFSKKIEQSPRQDTRSAWERQPEDYRKLCERIAKQHKLSPQNKRVRAAADRTLIAQRSK